uniref:Uncharacterized protein n=1 Tax=Rhizophora mucronata TaxID=61149 RepID=A0A2P2QX85_RHIMU
MDQVYNMYSVIFLMWVMLSRKTAETYRKMCILEYVVGLHLHLWSERLVASARSIWVWVDEIMFLLK